MRVISFNVNGIRAARRKGFFEWLATQQADVVCLQEVRAEESQLTEDIYFPTEYECIYEAAEKKGYSGVAIYTKRTPNKIKTSFGYALADSEARYLQVDFDNLSIISLYMPSGSNEARQSLKYEFMDHYLPVLKKQMQDNRTYIICGDWNIVHKEIDIKNWRSNQKSSGCLPEERAWLDNLFDNIGFVDAFRVVEPAAEQYTWWSNRGRARENNVGWRIDYQVISPNLKEKVQRAYVYKDVFFSDHAPLIIDYAL